VTDDYILEFQPQGRYVKVTAIDPVSGREAVIVGDASQSQQTLGQHAVNKLNYLLKK
jgi:hypothetical protein